MLTLQHAARSQRHTRRVYTYTGLVGTIMLINAVQACGGGISNSRGVSKTFVLTPLLRRATLLLVSSRGVSKSVNPKP